MAIKKTELYSSLWASADELRGGMDASEYKEDEYQTFYILFLKYLRLSHIVADLKGIDYDNEGMEKIAEYVFECMPHKEFLANVMTPEYFPDTSEMMRLMMIFPGKLVQKNKNYLMGLDYGIFKKFCQVFLILTKS